MYVHCTSKQYTDVDVCTCTSKLYTDVCTCTSKLYTDVCTCVIVTSLAVLAANGSTNALTLLHVHDTLLCIVSCIVSSSHPKCIARMRHVFATILCRFQMPYCMAQFLH